MILTSPVTPSLSCDLPPLSPRDARAAPSPPRQLAPIDLTSLSDGGDNEEPQHYRRRHSPVIALTTALGAAALGPGLVRQLVVPERKKAQAANAQGQRGIRQALLLSPTRQTTLKEDGNDGVKETIIAEANHRRPTARVVGFRKSRWDRIEIGKAW